MLRVSPRSRKQLQSVVYPLDGGEPYHSALDPTLFRVTRRMRVQNYVIVNPSNYNLQLMSFREYKNVDLWWVLGVFNGIVNPFTEVTQGKVMLKPDITSVEDYLREGRRIARVSTVRLP